MSHAATLLPNGQLLIRGGDAGGSATNTAELYDPSTDSLVGTSAMTMRRAGHAATLLPNGQVLITAGRGALHGPVAGFESSSRSHRDGAVDGSREPRRVWPGRKRG